MGKHTASPRHPDEAQEYVVSKAKIESLGREVLEKLNNTQEVKNTILAALPPGASAYEPQRENNNPVDYEQSFFEYDPNDLSEPNYLWNDDNTTPQSHVVTISQPTGIVTESENLLVPIGTKVTVNAQGTYEVTPPLAGGLPGPDPFEGAQLKDSFKDELAEASRFNEQTRVRVMNNFFDPSEDIFTLDYDENGTTLHITGPGRFLAKTLKTLLRHG